MNFLFVLDYFSPSKWWVERVFENIINWISQNNKIIILTSRFSNNLAKYEKKWNIEIYRIWKNRFFFTIFASFYWLNLLKNIDIIHTSTYNSAYVVYFLHFFTNAKIILTSHEILWKNWYNFKWKLKWFFYKVIEDLIYKMWFFYVFVSNHVKNVAITSYNLDLKQIKTIYNWLEKISIMKTFSKESLWFKKTDIIWVFAGRPGWTKWLDFLLKNFKEIQKINKNFKLLLLVIEKKNMKKIKNILKKTEKLSWIKILFEIPHKNVFSYIKIADIWIVPSRTEWFGYTALEMSSLWKKTVLADVWWIPEINFWDCHFFKVWDDEKFIECFKDIFMWKVNNYWYNKNLSIKKMVNSYKKLYF